ncbi:hypothetical protein SNEBB_000284 [Seison nebaliae]|nr:hypothetical protein SNEBB_000284 [Seison nebaliae]
MRKQFERIQLNFLKMNKKKEKVVILQPKFQQMIDYFLLPANDDKMDKQFFDELFLLRCDINYIWESMKDYSIGQVIDLRKNFRLLFENTIRILDMNNRRYHVIRHLHSLQLLLTFQQIVLTKIHSSIDNYQKVLSPLLIFLIDEENEMELNETNEEKSEEEYMESDSYYQKVFFKKHFDKMNISLNCFKTTIFLQLFSKDMDEWNSFIDSIYESLENLHLSVLVKRLHLQFLLILFIPSVQWSGMENITNWSSEGENVQSNQLANNELMETFFQLFPCSIFQFELPMNILFYSLKSNELIDNILLVDVKKEMRLFQSLVLLLQSTARKELYIFSHEFIHILFFSINLNLFNSKHSVFRFDHEKSLNERIDMEFLKKSPTLNLEHKDHFIHHIGEIFIDQLSKFQDELILINIIQIILAAFLKFICNNDDYSNDQTTTTSSAKSVSHEKKSSWIGSLTNAVSNLFVTDSQRQQSKNEMMKLDNVYLLLLLKLLELNKSISFIFPNTSVAEHIDDLLIPSIDWTDHSFTMESIILEYSSTKCPNESTNDKRKIIQSTSSSSSSSSTTMATNTTTTVNLIVDCSDFTQNEQDEDELINKNLNNNSNLSDEKMKEDISKEIEELMENENSSDNIDYNQLKTERIENVSNLNNNRGTSDVSISSHHRKLSTSQTIRNGLVILLEYSSIVYQNYRLDDVKVNIDITFLLLEFISRESEFLMSFISDPSNTFSINLRRARPKYRRKISKNPSTLTQPSISSGDQSVTNLSNDENDQSKYSSKNQSEVISTNSEMDYSNHRQLLTSFIDLMIEYIETHLTKKFPIHLYLLSLTIIQRIVIYLKEYCIRITYDWLQLWTALHQLMQFLHKNSTTFLNNNINIFILQSKIVCIINVFVTHGDRFLHSIDMYDVLYYELLRVFHQSYERTHELACQHTRTDKKYKLFCIFLVNQLINIRGVYHHFNEVIENYKEKNNLQTLTEEEILSLIRNNYERLTLRLYDNLHHTEWPIEVEKYVCRRKPSIRQSYTSDEEYLSSPNQYQRPFIDAIGFISPSQLTQRTFQEIVIEETQKLNFNIPQSTNSTTTTISSPNLSPFPSLLTLINHI